MSRSRVARVGVVSLLVLFVLSSVAPVPILSHTRGVQAQSAVTSLRPDIRVRRIFDTGTTSRSVRLAKDPRNNRLYYLKSNGDVYRVDLAAATSTRLYTSLEHGASKAQGFAIGPNGTMFIVGNEDRSNAQTRATIVKGVPDANGRHLWSTLAQSADYPKSNTAYDHRFNGIVVNPTGNYVYINSGSRTDHGEVQSAGGLFPNTREAGITAVVLRLPTSGQNLFLPNDLAALKEAGYIFVEGIRNSFDFAYAPNGDLLATENGPDRDMSDELNWLRAGLHYGFPWRIGGADNPQQYPDYDPSSDLLLDPRFTAVKNGYYQNDPAFPPRPSVSLAEPATNAGPDADSYRDPQNGQIKDASSLDQTLSTFTTHRSPLGLVFDGAAGALSPEFHGGGFMLSWSAGDPAGDSLTGPFKDPSQDLVHLALTKSGSNGYTIRTTRIVAGFNHPIDSEIIGNQIYVIEYGGTGGLWEVTLPAGANLLRNGGFEQDGNGDTRPDDWTSDSRFTRSSAGVRSGRFGGQHQSTTNVSYTISQAVPGLSGGRTYNFAGWVNIPATSDAFTFKLEARWRNSSNTVLGTSTIRTYTRSTVGWDYVQANVSAPAGTTNAEVRMVVSDLNATVHVDDFVFRPLSYVKDHFSRSIVDGWGRADSGGSYSLSGPAADFDVTGSGGTINAPVAGAGREAYLGSVTLRDADLRVRVKTDKRAADGVQDAYLLARRVSNGTTYRLRLRLTATGSVRLQATRLSDYSEALLGTEVTVSGLAHAANSYIWLRGQVQGANPTTIRMKAWRDGQPEPSNWLYSTTDATSGLQTVGTVGLRTYLSSATSNGPVRFTLDDFQVVNFGG